MKRAIVILVVMVVGMSVFSNGAYAKVALAQVRIKVVDQDGDVVPNARIWGGFTCGGGMNDYVLVDGVTDTNGMYVALGKCNEFLRFDVRKEGYYRTSIKIDFWRTKSDPKVIDGRWQPYGETRTVVLKRIKKPGQICTFPSSSQGCRIPEFGRWIGFDLEHADWVAPYGKGQHLDVLLKFTAMEKRMNDYKYEMEVSFTNNPCAGAYCLQKDASSQLTTVYAADSNATYQTSFKFVKEQSPGAPRHWDFLNSDSYLVFRTRTRVDEHGNLISAHYGKIVGQWLSELDLMILSDGCFNPGENDVNVEDGRALRDVLRNMRRP